MGVLMTIAENFKSVQEEQAAIKRETSELLGLADVMNLGQE